MDDHLKSPREGPDDRISYLPQRSENGLPLALGPSLLLLVQIGCRFSSLHLLDQSKVITPLPVMILYMKHDPVVNKTLMLSTIFVADLTHRSGDNLVVHTP
jgi:hypothetical protein